MDWVYHFTLCTKLCTVCRGNEHFTLFYELSRYGQRGYSVLGDCARAANYFMVMCVTCLHCTCRVVHIESENRIIASVRLTETRLCKHLLQC